MRGDRQGGEWLPSSQAPTRHSGLSNVRIDLPSRSHSNGKQVTAVHSLDLGGLAIRAQRVVREVSDLRDHHEERMDAHTRGESQRATTQALDLWLQQSVLDSSLAGQNKLHDASSAEVRKLVLLWEEDVRIWRESVAVRQDPDRVDRHSAANSETVDLPYPR